MASVTSAISLLRKPPKNWKDGRDKMNPLKKMFRQQIAEQERNERPVKAIERNPDVLVKRECTHRECAGLSKCQKDRNYGGIDY